MSNQELARNSDALDRAIKKTFPNLNDQEAVRLSAILLEEIGKRVAAGDQISFLRRDAEGNLEITVLALEILDKDRNEGSDSQL